MFWNATFLRKKNKFSVMWIAGSLGTNKLKKSEILQSDIPSMCRDLENPPEALALRATGWLYYGIVKIENRKAFYHDLQATEVKAKLRRGARSKVDLPKSDNVARHDTITTTVGQIDPEVDHVLIQFDDMDFNMDLSDMELDDEGFEGHMYVKVPSAGASRPTVSHAEEKEHAALDFKADVALGEGAELHAPLDLQELDMDIDLPDINFSPYSSSQSGNQADAEMKSLPSAGNASSVKSPPEVGAAMDMDDVDQEDNKDQSPSKKKRKARQLVPDTLTTLTKLEIKQRMEPGNYNDLLVHRPVRTKAFKFDMDAPLFSVGPDLFDFQRSIVPQLATDHKKSAKRHKKNRTHAANNSPPSLHNTSSSPDFMHAPLDEQDFADDLGMEIGSASVIDHASEIESIELARRGSSVPRRESFLGMRVDGSDAAWLGNMERARNMRRSGRYSLVPLNVSGLSESDGPSRLVRTEDLDSQIPLSQFDLSVRNKVGDEVDVDEGLHKCATVYTMALLNCMEVAGIGNSNEEKEFESIMRAHGDDNEDEPILKRDAAVAFYNLLVLASYSMVKVRQDQPYGPIHVRKGPSFETQLSSSQAV